MKRALAMVLLLVAALAAPASGQDETSQGAFATGALESLTSFMELQDAETTAEAQTMAAESADEMAAWLLDTRPPECLVAEYLAYWRMYAAMERIGRAADDDALLAAAEDVIHEITAANDADGDCQ